MKAAQCTFFPHTGNRYSYLIPDPDGATSDVSPGDFLVVQGPRGNLTDYRVVKCHEVVEASTLNPTWSYKNVLFNLGKEADFSEDNSNA
jgi:hypothetical protein